MSRAHLSRRLSDADTIRLFAEHHIVQVRRRKNGEITKVKHVAWGWMDPKAYYAAQEFHALLPKLIEGGYRVKSALWGMQLSIFGFSVPVGGSIPAYAVSKLALSLAEGHPENAAIWGAALALPFGDIFILEQMLADMIGVSVAVGQGITGAVISGIDIGVAEWTTFLNAFPKF